MNDYCPVFDFFFHCPGGKTEKESPPLEHFHGSARLDDKGKAVYFKDLDGMPLNSRFIIEDSPMREGAINPRIYEFKDGKIVKKLKLSRQKL